MGRLQMALLFVVACFSTPPFGFSCNPVDRKALLQFKHSFVVDRCNSLTSWVGEDCCSWNGVGCDTVTGNVIKLDLSSKPSSEPSFDGFYYYLYCLEAGEVNPALLELKYLTYLDLSYVQFNGPRIPHFFGSMSQLQHLDLSATYLPGNWANVLGNLTQLVFLDLAFPCWPAYCESGNIEWASKLKSLKYLDMSGVDLSQALDSLNILFNLPSLLNLTLSDCGLGNSHLLFIRNSSISSSHIHHLVLSGNYFDGPIPHFIQNLSAIRFLDLSLNLPIPHFIQNLSAIRFLDLSSNLISPIPSWLGDKVDLEHLDLSYNSFNGSFPTFNALGNLTQLVFLDLRFSCLWPSYCESGNLEWASKLKNLQYLDMSGANLSQALDSLTILFKLPSLLNLTLSLCELGNSHLFIRNSSISSSHIHHLDLSDNNFDGPIPHFIQNLSTIRFLDLSRNNLISPIPSWLGDKVDLQHLDLSGNNFNGSFLHFHALERFSSLSYLDLSSNHFKVVSSVIGNISSLQNLDLSFNNLETLPSSIWGLPSLSALQLSYNHLTVVPASSENSSSLKTLDISNNNLETLPPSLWQLMLSLSRLDLSHNNLRVVSLAIRNFSSLEYLDLSNNKLEALPSSLWQFSSLSYLYLSNNNLSVVSPPNGNLSSLRELDLSNNHLETLNLSLCQFPSLWYLNLAYNHFSLMSPFIGNLSFLLSLDLSHNNLSAVLPPNGNLSSLGELDLSNNHLETLYQSLSQFPSLWYLNLSYNHFSVMPQSLGTLSSLQYLDLAYNNLSVVNQVSLANLSSLRFLHISSSSTSLRLDLSPDWMPSFQLWFLSVLPCKLNGPFPKWILNQENLEELDLSNTGIFGPLPKNISVAMPSLQSLRLGNNYINGSIPSSLCRIVGLKELRLQNNMLTGVIPDCWENSQIEVVELSSNGLFGNIPNSLTKANTVQLMSLGNNSLEGELPLPLSNSAELTILDVGRNNLHGEIPPWIGANFPLLQVLILRENSFNGTIPQQLCSFQSLQIIDLASNNLVGTIPRCFGYFQGMVYMHHSNALTPPPTSPIASNITSDLASEPAVSPDEWTAVEVIKGDEREYTTILHLLVNIDLSRNNLTGVIPTEFTNLSLLFSLNLSHNHLTGSIPTEIGKMKSLESLDLSSNNLSGRIPESISYLDSLSKMNLSFNNLQGPIPTGRHLETLDDPSIYMGNPGLCGARLPKKCFGDGTAHPPTSEVLEDGGDDKKEKMWFYMVIMLGFATGFWGVIGILVVHKRWRHAYFQIAEEFADWIYVKWPKSLQTGYMSKSQSGLLKQTEEGEEKNCNTGPEKIVNYWNGYALWP